MTTCEDLHQLVNCLSDEDLDADRRLLEYFRSEQDSVIRSLLTAIEEDEPETEQDRRSVAEAKAAYETGDWTSLEQVRRELGQ